MNTTPHSAKTYLFKKPPLNVAGSSEELFRKKSSLSNNESKHRSRAYSDGGPVSKNKIASNWTHEKIGTPSPDGKKKLKQRNDIEFEEEGGIPKSGTKEALTSWIIQHNGKCFYTLGVLIYR